MPKLKRNSRKLIRVDEDTLKQIKEVEYGRGYQEAKQQYENEVRKAKAQRALEESRINAQSIDAICHAITAMARLIDGQDAR